MPQLGYGVGMNSNTLPTVLEAFKAGYRRTSILILKYLARADDSQILIALNSTGTKPSVVKRSGEAAYPARKYSTVCSCIDPLLIP